MDIDEAIDLKILMSTLLRKKGNGRPTKRLQALIKQSASGVIDTTDLPLGNFRFQKVRRDVPGKFVSQFSITPNIKNVIIKIM